MGRIEIYGSIGTRWWDVIDTSAVRRALDEMGPSEKVEIYINSPGGDVFEATGIYNLLRRHKGRVVVYVDGLAASAASFVAMAADEVIMPENAWLMVHNPWTMTAGNASHLRSTADWLDEVRESTLLSYKRKTGLDEQAIRDLLDGEGDADGTWLSASRAVELGFADRIEEENDEDAVAVAVASLDLSKMNRVPEQLVALASRGQALIAARPAAAPRGDTMPDETTMAAANQQAAPAARPTNPAPQASALQDAPQASAPPTPAPQAPAAPTPARADAGTILAACERYGMDVAFASTLVNEGVTLVQMHERINDALLARQAPPTTNHIRATVGQSGGEKMVEGVTNALLARAGLAEHDSQNQYAGLTLREIARECLNAASVDVAGLDPFRMVGVAFTARAAITHTSSDFTNILANVAHKAMMRGYEEAEETFEQWCTIGNLSDFKPVSRVDLSTFPSLKKVEEGAEYTHATVGDSAELIQLATYGRMFSITRQAIINDDLDSFTRIPRAMGRAAHRTVGDLVYAILVGNPNMSDGTALFHASRKNLSTGANSALSAESLDKARADMRRQKDGDAVLGIRPANLIVPATLEGTALTLMAAENKPGDAEKVPNPVRNMAQVVVEARLDDASTTAWYLAASKNTHDTIEVAFLNGNRAPRLEQREGWGVDGVENKVGLDAGVKAVSAKTMHKATGA